MTAESERIALAFSFANLVYLRVWFDLLVGAPGAADAKHPAGSSDFCAALFNVFLLAALTWGCLRWRSALPLLLRRLLVFAGLLLAANSVRSVAAAYTPLLRSGAFQFITPKTAAVLAVLTAAAAAYCLFHRFALTTAILRAALLACLPAVPVTCITGAVRAALPPAPIPEPALAAKFPSSPRTDRRVIWAIFDEWDQRLTFTARPRGLELYALDQLAARSLVGTRVLAPQGAIPVARMATQVALPSLLAGEVRKAGDFHAPHLFSKVHERGWNVAIGGWYIPYCRLFAGEAFKCYWDQMYTQSTAQGAPFAEAVAVQNRSLFETSLYSLFGQSFTSERHAAEFKAIRDFALDAAADPSAGVVFLHFNTPHAPHFYDAKADRLDAPGQGAGGYLDSLVLVDRTVAQLVDNLDSNTVLILSADHPLRVPAPVDGLTDVHVPLLVHFPGQSSSLRLEQEFSALHTAPLILEILDGRVRTAEEASEFLESDVRSTGFVTH